MGDRFTTLWQTRSFLESLERLARRQPRLRQRVYRVLDRYYDRPDALQRSIIRNPRRRVFHTRIDREKRLIDQPLDPERPRELAILYIDHHDSANRWAATYRGDTLALIEKAQRLERPGRIATSTPRTTAVSEQAAVPISSPVRTRKAADSGPDQARGRARPEDTFGKHLSGGELRKLGVPSRFVDVVLRSSVSADLAEAGVDEKTADRIHAWYSSKVPLAPIPRRVPSLEPPEAIAVTRGQLRTVLSLNLAQLVSSLSEEQRALARRENRNLYVVKGAAGSGKTVVGIRRIEFLLEQRGLFDKPILFVCYNKVLANVARQMIEDTIGRPVADAGIEVWAAYELLASLQTELRVRPPEKRYIGPERLLALLRYARKADQKGLLSDWSDRALLDEILEVIYGRGLSSLEEYRETNRRGRGRPLRREGRHRAAIWAIHERLRSICEDRGVAPWDDLPVRVARALAEKPPTAPRFSAIVIDEAQDLLPIIFRVLLSLQAGRDDNILVLGDAAQNVYRSGFRWGHTGLAVASGQVTYLRRCYRSTPSIISAAAPLVRTQKRRLEGDLVVPEGEGDDGPPVDVNLYGWSRR